MNTRIFLLLILLITIFYLVTCIPLINCNNHTFYWVRPGVYAIYCSDPRASVILLKDVKISDEIVYVIKRIYLAKMCFSWTILDVRDNLAYVNFTIILDDILKKGIEEWIPYALGEEPAPSYMYPPIPSLGPTSSVRGNMTTIYYNLTKLTLSKNITIDLNNMKAYYDGEPVGLFFFILPPEILTENKPLIVFSVTTDFKKWNIEYRVNEKDIDRYTYNAIADLKPLQELSENASFRVNSIILSGPRLLRTETRAANLSKEHWMYFEENRTLISYIYDPKIPKMYYDTLSGILVAIALEEVTPGYEPVGTYSEHFQSNLLYGLFNVTYVAISGEVESPEYIVDGFYRLEIKLVDTNIPLEKPVFGKVEGYGEEYSLFKVLLFSLAFVLTLVIILFRRFR